MAPPLRILDLQDPESETGAVGRGRPELLTKYTIWCIRDGTGFITRNGHVTPLEPGLFLFGRPSDLVSIDVAQPLRGRIILFGRSVLVRSLPANEGFPLLHVIDPHTGPQHIVLSSEDTDRCITLTDQIAAQEQNHDDDLEDAFATTLLRLLLLHVERLHRAERPADSTAAKGLERFITFRTLLEEHVTHRWRISEYANELGITPRTLHTLCVDLSRRTPKQLLDDRTVLEAQRRLVHSDETISMIAYAVGFSDPSQLARLFRRTTGESPSAFRARARPSTGNCGQ